MKNSITMKLTLAASIIAGGISQAVGSDWTLLYDFEGETALDGVFATVITEGYGELQLHPDPMNPENTVFYAESGGYGVANHNTLHVALDMPHIEVDSTVTMYMRYYQAGPSNSFHWTLTPIAVGLDSADRWEPRVWGQFEMILRHGLPADPSLVEIGNAGRYMRVGTIGSNENFVPFVHVDGVWYEYWMVIINEIDPLDDRVHLYVRGGQFSEPTLLKIQLIDIDNMPTGDYIDFAYLRNGVDQPLRTMTISTQSGWQDNPFAGDHFYVDDIYVANGEVLTSPVGDPDPVVIWNGLVVNAHGAVNAGGLLGMVYIPDTEMNWGYSMSLESWVSIGRIHAFGDWVYVMDDGSQDNWLSALEVPEAEWNWAYTMSPEETWVYLGDTDSNGGWIHFRK